jgi:predicted lipid-binding transport protein (Tim44 family)
MSEKVHPMRRPGFLIAAIAAAALTLTPILAEARPGGGGGSGSRGSRTYSAPPSTSTAPGTARPMERTMQPSTPASPGVGQAARPPIGQPNPAGGFFSRSPFMAGMMGGLIGVGLGGLLFGNGLFSGFSGFASILGLLLQIGLIVLVVRLAIGFFRRRQAQPAMAGMAPQGGMARVMDGGGRGPMGGVGGGAPATTPVQVRPEDFSAFEQLLKSVNDAWSRQDTGTLQRLATPEMVRYFSDDLADLAARGWRNETRDVALEQGDLAEAWREGNQEFATVAMRFSMVDVTRRLADGAVVEGDPNSRTQTVEIWTFVRNSGGAWQLSAIQQTDK